MRVGAKSASFSRAPPTTGADIAFGAKHYELLRTIGAFVQQLKDVGAHVKADGSMKGIDGIEAARLDEGPSLLTLVRVAHAAGSRLVISLEDADDSHKSVEVLRL